MMDVAKAKPFGVMVMLLVIAIVQVELVSWTQEIEVDLGCRA
jgi:hypothetical protein